MTQNGLARFLRRGIADADARVAAVLAPRPLGASDRYVWSSAVVQWMDRLTRRLQDLWLASEAGGAVSAASEAWQREPWHLRHTTVATVLLMATAVHVVLTLIQGPRPGWYWLVLPGMVVMFAALLLKGRSTH